LSATKKENYEPSVECQANTWGKKVDEKESFMPCPYLRINSESCVCQANTWGKKVDGKESFMPITTDIILGCSSEQHVECPSFRKLKAQEERTKRLRGACQVLNGEYKEVKP